MRVADLLSGPVVTLQVDDTLAEAAREMDDNGLAAVVVCEGGVLVGILCEGDVVRSTAEGAAAQRTLIEEYMTAAPVTVPPEADPEEALRAMLDGGFRHIPVVGSDGDVVGVLTMTDIVRARATTAEREARSKRERMTATAEREARSKRERRTATAGRQRARP